VRAWRRQGGTRLIKGRSYMLFDEALVRRGAGLGEGVEADERIAT
jgi:hypothetical protein